ncbi:hypothetical protein SAMN05444166_3949 [Singulisphaera sp. GP187]|nr:hypothetical protein SAMN05444166_3949 [Singulisphaera sp. GP187]
MRGAVNDACRYLVTQTTIQRKRDAPRDLRAICDVLNDERGTGGQSKLARLLGWD